MKAQPKGPTHRIRVCRPARGEAPWTTWSEVADSPAELKQTVQWLLQCGTYTDVEVQEINEEEEVGRDERRGGRQQRGHKGARREGRRDGPDRSAYRE